MKFRLSVLWPAALPLAAQPPSPPRLPPVTADDLDEGPRNFQLAVLITAREIDQQYEWTAHEPAALRQGLEQSVIDVVKYDKSVAGLSDKDATMITFGRVKK